MHTVRTLLAATTALAATGFATIGLASSAYARPMTPEDVAQIEQVGAVAISPDGSRIAYTTVRLPDITDGEGNGASKSELKVAWAADQWRSFVPDDVSPGSIAYSPDGRMISFTWAKDKEDRAVWGIPIDGGAQRKLAYVDGASVLSYDWSPDGSTLYLLVGAQEDTARTKASKAGFNSIVYEEEPQLNRLFAASVGEEPDADPREISVPGYTTTLDILPDGQTAIIGHAPTPQIDDEYTSKKLSHMRLDTGAIARTYDTTAKLGDIEIAPDGVKFSLIAGVDIHDPAETTLHYVDIASGAITALNGGAAEAAMDAEFLPDGTLAAIIHTGASSVLRYYDASGAMTQQLDSGGIVLEAVRAAGDKVAFVADSARHPNELFVLDGQEFVRWTAHNSWLSDIDFGAQRTMTYTARDGQVVEGILIEPVGGAAKGGSPTIMMVHGGPEAHYTNGWLTAYSMPGHVGAGQGYAVFHPNYRGSTGYGVAFSKQHQGDYAGKEFNDIVDAKRALVAAGITDPDRTGITGGSYGGYASAWGATALSEEYAASVMFVGISNQTSKFGTGDIPYEMYNVHSLAWPWDNWQKMLEVSPIYHTGKANTPILIMHGLEDTRVDPGQSFELYRFLKIRQPDLPVRMVLYPGEGHGNRKAASRYEYNLRMMRWFDTYLKTGDRNAPMPSERPDLPAGTTGGPAAKKADD